MRSLLALVALVAGLSACRVEPPGAADVHAANQILSADGSQLRVHGQSLSPKGRERAFTLLDRAAAAGHPFASTKKAFIVMHEDGLMAAEPHFRAIVDDPLTTARQRDQAYGMLAAAASARPLHEAGLTHNDLPAGRHLAYYDVLGEVDVLKEAVAAGSALADTALRERLDHLHRQRTAGDADADSLLALLDA